MTDWLDGWLADWLVAWFERLSIISALMISRIDARTKKETRDESKIKPPNEQPTLIHSPIVYKLDELVEMCCVFIEPIEFIEPTKPARPWSYF